MFPLTKAGEWHYNHKVVNWSQIKIIAPFLFPVTVLQTEQQRKTNGFLDCYEIVESLTLGRTLCYRDLLCQRRQNWVPRQNDSEKNLVRFENQPNYRQTDSEKMLVWFENKRNYRQNDSEKIQVSDLKTSPTTAKRWAIDSQQLSIF